LEEQTGRNNRRQTEERVDVSHLDASPRNLEVVAQEVSKAKAPRDRLVCHAVDLVQRIPLEGSSVDAVLDVWVLGSAILFHDGRAGAERYLAEVHRILKPDGVFACEFVDVRFRAGFFGSFRR